MNAYLSSPGTLESYYPGSCLLCVVSSHQFSGFATYIALDPDRLSMDLKKSYRDFNESIFMYITEEQ